MNNHDLIGLLIFIIIVYLATYLLSKVHDNRVTQFIPEFIGIIGVLYQLIINRNESFKELGFIFSVPKMYLYGILAISGVLIIILSLGCYFVKLKLKKDLRYKKVLVFFIKLFFFNTLVAVFTEELVFRGCIQRQLQLYLSPGNSIIIASAIFGIWHIPFGNLFKFNKTQIILYPFGAGLVGILLGYFYCKSQSLIVAGILHGLWNAIVYTIWGVGGNLKGVFADRKDSLTHPEYGVIGIIVLTLSAVIMLLIV